MPMTEEQQQTVMNSLAAQTGCPMGIKDKLDAFNAGVTAAVKGMANFVSIDADALKKSKVAPENKGNRKQRRASKKGK